MSSMGGCYVYPLTPNGFRLMFSAFCPVTSKYVQVRVNGGGWVWGCVNQCLRLRLKIGKPCCCERDCLVGRKLSGLHEEKVTEKCSS